MKKLTLQQMFNKSVLGVVKQGALSNSHRGGCKYRMVQDGKTLACGVGQLIEPDLYSPGIEGTPADDANPDRSYCSNPGRADKLMLALCFSGVDVTDYKNIKLLEEVQWAHDDAESVEEYVLRCQELAKDWKFTMPRLPAKYA